MISRGRTIIVAAVATAICAFGLVAGWVAYGPGGHLVSRDQTYLWIIDLVTGMVLLGCGALVTQRRQGTLVGPLLLFASVAWFVGTAVELPRFIGTAVAPSVVFLYRGFLAHVIMTFPTGRPADRLEWLAVGIAYASSLLAPLWYSPNPRIVLLLLLVAVTWRAYRRARGWTKAARRDALGVAVLFASTVALLAVGYLVQPPYPFADVMTIAFHLVLMAGVIRLTMRLLHSDQLALTNLVVELGGMPSTTLGGELARLLDDPTIRVGRWSSGLDAYLDESGQVMAQVPPDSAAAALRIDQDGHPLALLVHQPFTLDDAELRRGVTDAVRLAAVNATLRDMVEEQVWELAASRRRVIVAGDDAGEELARRVRDGAMAHLAAVDAHLRAAAARVRDPFLDEVGDRGIAVAIERSQQRLGRALEDLRGFALGLDPRPLATAGLAGGLNELARDCPVPVQVLVDVPAVPNAVATDAYLVCAEALTNIAKHAGASRVRIDASIAAGRLQLEVTDDGVGGATLDGGTGLRGLADRVASLEGTLVVRSTPGSGTQLVARWPLDRDSLMSSTSVAEVAGTRRYPSADPTVSPDVVPAGHS